MAPNGFLHVHSLCSAAVVVLTSLLLSSCVLTQTGTRPVDSNAVDPGAVERVRWTRIHGAGDPSTPPIMRLPIPGRPNTGFGADALTLTFDVSSTTPPNYTLLLIHCDRNWKPTQSVFIQDNIRLRTTDLEVQRSPVAAKYYDYTVSVTFPRSDLSLRIEHSGNYIARVVDYYDNDRVVTEARFFVVEPRAAVSIDYSSDFYRSLQTEGLQHGDRVHVEVTPAYDLSGGEMASIVLYRGGEWYQPIVAAGDSLYEGGPGRPWIRWSSYFAGKAVAEFRNLPAGNEHRILDLTDISLYPTTGTMISTPLSDLPRMNFTEYDHNGMLLPGYVTTLDADYVYFEFRLDVAGRQAKQDIFVVGTFSDWIARPEWRMFYDRASGFYIGRGWIRRAVHEYQYVAGTWDEDRGVLRDPDATLLEGNLTSATTLYFAFAYYHDVTAGGYDRLVGAAGTLVGGL